MIAGIEVLLNVGVIFGEFETLFLKPEDGLITILAAIIVEITAVVCVVEMMVYSVRLRKVRKKMRENMQIEEKGGQA